MNADLAGVASFHGLLTPPGIAPESDALSGPIEPGSSSHGWDDPTSPPKRSPPSPPR